MFAKKYLSDGIYTSTFLNFYDLYVLRFSNRWVWRCPSRYLLAHYNRNVTSNHLDVGVGTGWYSDNCTFPTASPRLAFLDRNENCLKEAAERCARYSPELLSADILAPFEADMEPFDSISLNYVLHCLPGPFEKKAKVFGHLLPYLNQGGTLFGATIVAEGAPVTRLGRRLIRFYNEKGIFGNASDSVKEVEENLCHYFGEWRTEVIGNVVLFEGRNH